MTATVRDAVTDIVAAVAQRPAQGLRSDDRLDDLGLDSLDRVAVVTRLERHFGSQMPDTVLLAAHTVGDLARYFAPTEELTQ